MAVNKVIYKGKTIIDITASTVSPETLVKGETAFNSAGELIEGNAEPPYLGGAEPVILVDEDGNEIAAVITDEELHLTATPNDVRAGVTILSDRGLVTGEKIIPSYNTHQGYRLIMPGKPFVHSGEHYDYTELQALICGFNTKISDSVSTEKVVINDSVYNVQSIEAISSVTPNDVDGTIDFGIINDTTKRKVLRYFYYKEIE